VRESIKIKKVRIHNQTQHSSSIIFTKEKPKRNREREKREKPRKFSREKSRKMHLVKNRGNFINAQKTEH
jgi:hypothetical protein